MGARGGAARGGFAGLVRRKHEKPIIGAVQGDALAGGFEVALGCDLLVCAEGIRMGLPEVKRSLVALAGELADGVLLTCMNPRFPEVIEANLQEGLALRTDGKKAEAVAAVTDAMVDAFHLVGPPERIRDHFQIWKESRVGTLIVGTEQIEAVRLMAELVAE